MCISHMCITREAASWALCLGHISFCRLSINTEWDKKIKFKKGNEKKIWKIIFQNCHSVSGRWNRGDWVMSSPESRSYSREKRNCDTDLRELRDILLGDQWAQLSFQPVPIWVCLWEPSGARHFTILLFHVWISNMFISSYVNSS